MVGLSIVLVSFMLIRREVLRASLDQRRSFNSLSDENVNQVMQYLKKIEKELDDLNAAYYEIVSDLEGKYSVHDKEIELLQERFHTQPQVVSQKQVSPTDQTLDEQDRICQEAAKLRQKGLTIGQIARQMNMGIGELQLILKTKK